MIHVLIVEDDPMVAAINKEFVEQTPNIKVIGSVKNSEDAKEFIQKRTVQLMLLDVYLPGETGLDLLTWLRMNKSQLAVILITAADDIETVKKAIDHGAIDYLIKPFTLARFQLAIDKFLKYTEALEGEQKTSQAKIDQFLLAEAAKEVHELPKGLSKLTLKNLYTEMQRFDAPFSTKELAEKVPLSRISTKKYLQFLVDIGVLEETIYYLEIGRPVTKYQLTQNVERLQQYF